MTIFRYLLGGGKNYRRFTGVIRKLIPDYGLKFEGSIRIARDCYFDRPDRVFFGKDVFVNRMCQFHIGSLDDTEIRIGDNVWIGMDVCFVCPTHDIGLGKKRAGQAKYYSINVGDGTWIGARSTILPGVSIGKGCVIAAGSVVTKKCEDNCLYAGIPAKLVRKL